MPRSNIVFLVVGKWHQDGQDRTNPIQVHLAVAGSQSSADALGRQWIAECDEDARCAGYSIIQTVVDEPQW